MRSSLSPSTAAVDYAFSHRLRVRFAETDAMGIVHHSRYLPYLEEARVEYLRAIGHPYDALRAEGVDIAVLEASVQYRQPLRFDDVVTVHLRMGAVTRTTFQLAYLITGAIPGAANRTDRTDRTGPDVRATAVTVHGCVTADGRPTRLPEWLRGLGGEVSHH